MAFFHARELIERRPPRLSADEEKRLALNTGGHTLPRSKARWRLVGSSAIKFEFVLTLTKNILPLLMMIVMGQVFNGLMVSMVTCSDQYQRNILLSTQLK
jgi:N-acetylmuramic acid 6-phosphate (MurNAc-6-P) etherase